MSFAENTTVSPEQSRMEIERTLIRYGADSFMYAMEDDKESNTHRAVLGFRHKGYYVKFLISLPSHSDRKYTHTPSRGNARTTDGAYKEWQKAVRQRWRALALVVKAKLEAVESGVTTFEEEFLAHILLPNQETVGQFLLPQVDEAYKSGEMIGGLTPLLGE